MESPSLDSKHPSHKELFIRSVDLFEKSFNELDHAKIDVQRKEYLQVMRNSLSVMQETANEMINKKLIGLKNQLSSDLTNYLANPSPETHDQVKSDIQSLKDSV